MTKKWNDPEFALAFIGVLWLALILCSSLAAPPRVEAQGGSISVATAADITGTGAQVQVYPSGGLARWVQIIAPGANAAVVRVGDASTSATVGLPIAAGGGFMLPPLPIDGRESSSAHFYNLANIYVYVANGDKVSIIYAR